MWCLKCGEKEPGSENHCKTCNFELGSPEKRDGFYLQMMRLTDKVLKDEISTEAYERAIHWGITTMQELSSNLELIEDKMKQFELGELDTSVISRPVRTFREGITTFMEGLEKLRDYSYEKNLTHITKGLPLLKKANNLFINATDTTHYIIGDISKDLESATKEDIQKYIGDNMKNK